MYAFLRKDRFEIQDTRRMRKIFIKDIFNILLLSLIQTTWNQLSTSRRLVPLSLQKGKRVAFFLLTNFSMLAFCKREHSASRLKSQFSSLKSVFSYPPADWLCKSPLLTSNLSFMHSPYPFPQALLSSLQALSSIIASPPLSPVRILMAVSSSDTKIFPSPTCPVLQVSRIVSISFSNGVS